jgi:hypothetical protein
MTITCFNVGTPHPCRESSPRTHALRMYQTRPRDWEGHRLPTGKHRWGPPTRMSTCVQCNKMFARTMPTYIIYTLHRVRATRREEKLLLPHEQHCRTSRNLWMGTCISINGRQDEAMLGTVTLRCADEIPRIHLHTTCTVALLDAPSACNTSRSVGWPFRLLLALVSAVIPCYRSPRNP